MYPAVTISENEQRARIISNRGGQDFFSGTFAGSITRIVGISFASWIRVNSYC